jgi:hypothetical protein
MRQALPTIKKHHKKDFLGTSNVNGQVRLRLPSLLRKPYLSPNVCVDFGGYSDRPKIRLEEKGVDEPIR